MLEISPYLFFDGNCAEAMRFYEKTLRGKLEMQTHGDSPEGTPENKDRILHARLEFNGGVLMASDDMVDSKYSGMHGFFVSLVVKTLPEAKSMFNALAAGGKVMMALDKTFWSEGFGMLTDKFGTPWMVNVASENT